MRILIIEDEMPAARRLERMLLEIDSAIVVLDVLDSIKSSISWLQGNEKPDLLFLDIHLADGLSTEIFEHLDFSIPVIFTTAFDDYAIKAFEVNSIGYLLKPLEIDRLRSALEKFKSVKKATSQSIKDLSEQIGAFIKSKDYKERFLIKRGEQFINIKSADIACFFSEDGYSFIQPTMGNKMIFDHSLDQIQNEINPLYFFRINRKTIVQKESVKSIKVYTNNRLIIKILGTDYIVSREKVKLFKEWLEQ